MADKLVSKDHEYLLCYQKSNFSAFSGIEKDFNNFSNPDNDPRGEWTKGDLTVGMSMLHLDLSCYVWKTKLI